MNQDTTTSPTSHSTTTNVTRLPHPDQLSLINSNVRHTHTHSRTLLFTTLLPLLFML